MPYDPAIHHRQSIRLDGYDYTQPGAYFVTICTHNRENLFGEIVQGEMRLNDYGRMVDSTWHDLIHHVDGIELGEFVVMPNHIHGIIIIVGANPVGAGSKPAPVPPTNFVVGAGSESARVWESGPAWGDSAREGAGLEPAPTNFVDVGSKSDLCTRGESGPVWIDSPSGDSVGAGSKPVPAPPTNFVVGADSEPAPSDFALSEIVRQLKTFSARRINAKRGTPGVPVWQRNYWERIIRDERAYQTIAAYILRNPKKWQEDKLHLDHSHDRH